MVTNTKENALEEIIETYLIQQNNFFKGRRESFLPQYAIDNEHFWHFLESSQPTELDKLKRRSNNSIDWQDKIIKQLDKRIKKDGILQVLRKGLEVEDAYFQLFYQLPLASRGESVHKNFSLNRFSVTRQVHFSISHPNESIDAVLFINGLPIITIELKNPWTDQNAKYHGILQYKERDYKQPLLEFGRTLVHFAVDTDEAYMTTKLLGKDTVFLPFNKGNNCSAGNPVNNDGYKTEYLWKEIFTINSIANIIAHFVKLTAKDNNKPNQALSNKLLYFPRYHQLEVVRKLIADVSHNGVGKTYLIQHSAGSGKSNSIAWLAYHLLDVYQRDNNDKPMFNSIVIVTDRRLLDKQIRDDVFSFEQAPGIIAPAYSAKDLKDNLVQGKRIIITTLQKFPFIIDGISDLSDKTFAIIIDEAHSSQSGVAADSMNIAMGNKLNDEDEFDSQDKLLEIMQNRKIRQNASYFAFTATPKAQTLEKFGIKYADGSFHPFHLYSMKQAIEEGFILDVLTNYTTYRSYYEINKSIEDNPEFDTSKAQKKLKAYVEKHPDTIEAKANIMLDHFINFIFNKKALHGQAKAMIVTQDIETAITYYHAIKKHLEKYSNPFKILVAFSGTKIIDGIEYSENKLNGFSETQTGEKFDSDEYRMLVVANKYLTGFDQPKLCAMYVDKKLQGVLAVQALSRLNRSCIKLGKRTENLFILDFFNSTNDIKEAFDPFYTATSLNEATDVNILHTLKAELDNYYVYDWQEVEDFIAKYFNNVQADQLSCIIDKVAQKFNIDLNLDNNSKADFKIKAKQFVKIYGQMASLMPFYVERWEKLFWFLKFLIPKLVVNNNNSNILDGLLDSVDLSTYSLERVHLNSSITLDDADSILEPQNSNPRSAYETEQQYDKLDEIIEQFNNRWAGSGIDKETFINLSKNIKNNHDYKNKYADNYDPYTRDDAFDRIVTDEVGQMRKNHIDFYKSYANNLEFKQYLHTSIKKYLKD